LCGASAARNLALKQARGAFIAFTDADCVVESEWLDKLLAGFTGDSRIGGSGGNQMSPQDDTDFGKLVTQFMKSVGFVIDYMKGEHIRVILTDHNASCNALYKKEVFEAVGGFCEGLWPGEDVDFDYRVRKAGFLLTYTPEAVVYHYRPSTTKGFIRMMYNYGRVQALLIRKYGFFRRLHAAPFFFSAAVIAVAATVRSMRLLRSLLWAPSAAHTFFFS